MQDNNYPPAQPQTRPPRNVAKILGHLRSIRAAGTETRLYLAALRAVHEDVTLNAAERDVILRVLAQSAYLGYRDCITGQQFDKAELAAIAAATA